MNVFDNSDGFDDKDVDVDNNVEVVAAVGDEELHPGVWYSRPTEATLFSISI